MVLTEEEAKTKWCPMARVLLPVNQSGNRISSFLKATAVGSHQDVEFYVQQEKDCCCLGSGCMMWRKVEDGTGYCGLTPPPAPRYSYANPFTPYGGADGNAKQGPRKAIDGPPPERMGPKG